MAHEIKVLIVDDSAVVRQVLAAILSKDPQIRVIAAAADPILAQEKMLAEWPDVIVLDVEMPRMDGITFLKKIMAERPTPVVICSTLTEKGAETTMQALAAGAVSYVTKPKLGLKDFLSESSAELIRSVKQAAQSRPKQFGRAVSATTSPSALASATLTVAHVDKPAPLGALARTTDKVIAIGTSTGGTQALEVILTALPRVSVGIVIVQHMPEKFTALFANRLNTLCEIEVREARHGDRVMPGRALIAPGGLHMRLTRSGAYYQVEVLDGPPVNRHKPSVDVLFKSVAQVAGRNALGIIMTGMGDDGARGLRDMHDAGANTIGQDEASCVVYGMPREAVKLEAVDVELPLDRIAAEMIRFYQKG
ncbi:chemotaxis response regulator protein-glutamate methylesterase [Actimicrobium antarcticum]|uniref:Protein-glutamate methylesterase/protein-glutamine glutaminase n=1 Tax=Actimicrobium antarcticum TaxID=1051899 RepID=A0ABP7SPL2_9BURK